MNKIFMKAIFITILVSSYTIFPAIENAQINDDLQVADNAKYKKSDIHKKEADSLESRFIKSEDKNLLARLVHAEAKGEPFAGKVAVATVVLNRVQHKQFPDTIKEVIYQKNAFEPVMNGSIHEPANKESYEAVEEALQEQGKDNELLYFYNPKTATSQWIFSRKVVKKIGNHSFAI
ncbi:cell wall hydrolase [Peribacillus sp. SCS-155]|uniref:cell wall hydrolase n=1 Tax=Peribacillus sedimenti TaxID=3115297 RepID=UPI00390605F4